MKCILLRYHFLKLHIATQPPHLTGLIPNIRRYDTRMKKFRKMYRSGAVCVPHHVEITTLGSHLGKEQDLVRDVDLLTWTLGEYPSHMTAKESSYEFVYPSGMTATIAHDSGDQEFYHKMQIMGENGSCLTVSNKDVAVSIVAKSCAKGESSLEEAPKKRQKTESSNAACPSFLYVDLSEEIAEFYLAISTFSPHNVLSVENLLACNLIGEKATAAVRNTITEISYSQLGEFGAFRDYSEAPATVRECYRLQRIFQTEKYVDDALARYCSFKRKGSFWELFDMLSTFVDLSDPDINLSNHQHLFQTAEGIRKDGLPEWMQVTGLIHDLGKIIYKIGRTEDGTTMESQWGIVGACTMPARI
jgi:hypothetical protein